MTLKFSVANTKVARLQGVCKEHGINIHKGEIVAFSIPAGFTCPFARDCKSYAHQVTGKLTDSATTQFRCFEASLESMYPATRKMVWHNFEELKAVGIMDVDAMASLISVSIPKKAKIIRLHVGGDFFNIQYFMAWRKVAIDNPNLIIYAYTKAVKYIVDFPAVDNFRLTASFGGNQDYLITPDMRSSRVVYSYEEANALGLELDHDERHALFGEKPFALLIHGTQPAKSFASIAKEALKKQGWTGYSS